MSIAAHRPTTQVDLSDPSLWLQGVPGLEFARLRREAPVAWNPRHDGHKGFWAVTRYDDIVEVSRDTEAFSSRHGVISLDDFDEDQNEARRTLLEMDPPQHTAMRRLTWPGFGPKAAARLEAAVRLKAAALLDELVGAGSFEAVGALTKQLPIHTLCLLLGVPQDRQEDLIRWSDLLIGSDDPDFVDPAFAGFSAEARRLLPFGHPASLEAFELGRQLFAARRRDPKDDIVTMLVQGTMDGCPLSDEAFCNYFLMLVVAGNETTRHSLSHGLMALAEHPYEWERFRREGCDARTATAEILRWATPVHFVRRLATRDVRLGGAEIEAGDKVAVYYASGNRDEAHFEDPTGFRLDRAKNHHMAFGHGGPHYCLGNLVAQLQIRVMLEEMAKRVSAVEMTGPALRLRSNHINGVKALPIRLHAV